MSTEQLRTEILTAITALQAALRALPPTHTEDMQAAIQKLSYPIPARQAYRLLAHDFQVSQRHAPGIMASLGYKREKKEAGIFWF